MKKKNLIISVVLLTVLLFFYLQTRTPRQSEVVEQRKNGLKDELKEQTINSSFVFSAGEDLWYAKLKKGQDVSKTKISSAVQAYQISPDKQKIVFINDWKLQVYDAEIRLTQVIADFDADITNKRIVNEYLSLIENHSLAWLDNNRFIFVGLIKDYADLYSFNLNEKKLTRLTKNEPVEFNLAVSPSSHKVSYFQTGNNISFNILQLDDQYQQEIFSTAALFKDQNNNAEFKYYWNNSEELTVSALRKAGTKLWKVNAADGNIEELGQEYHIREVVFSSSNNRILCLLQEKGILIVNGDAIREIKTEGRVVTAEWFNGQDQIAYVTQRTFNDQQSNSKEIYFLYVGDLKKEEPSLINSFSEWEIKELGVNEQTDSILYLKTASDQEDELWVINSDGSHNKFIEKAALITNLNNFPGNPVVFYSKQTQDKNYINYLLDLTDFTRNNLVRSSDLVRVQL